MRPIAEVLQPLWEQGQVSEEPCRRLRKDHISLQRSNQVLEVILDTWMIKVYLSPNPDGVVSAHDGRPCWRAQRLHVGALQGEAAGTLGQGLHVRRDDAGIVPRDVIKTYEA